MASIVITYYRRSPVTAGEVLASSFHLTFFFITDTDSTATITTDIVSSSSEYEAITYGCQCPVLIDADSVLPVQPYSSIVVNILDF